MPKDIHVHVHLDRQPPSSQGELPGIAAPDVDGQLVEQLRAEVEKLTARAASVDQAVERIHVELSVHGLAIGRHVLDQAREAYFDPPAREGRSARSRRPRPAVVEGAA